MLDKLRASPRTARTIVLCTGGRKFQIVLIIWGMIFIVFIVRESFLLFLSCLSLGKPFIVFIGRKSFYPFIAPTGEGEEGAENKTFGVRPLGVQDIPWAALRRIVFNRLQEFRLRVGPSERGG